VSLFQHRALELQGDDGSDVAEDSPGLSRQAYTGQERVVETREFSPSRGLGAWSSFPNWSACEQERKR
jgi:hypothetical protein